MEVLSKRQPPSCDACRTRKLKCAGRPERIELGPEAIALIPCDHCREWGLDCSYLYQRKRRGRKNLVVERLAEEQKKRKSDLTRATFSDPRDPANNIDIIPPVFQFPSQSYISSPPKTIFMSQPTELSYDKSPWTSTSLPSATAGPSSAGPSLPNMSNPLIPPTVSMPPLDRVRASSAGVGTLGVLGGVGSLGGPANDPSPSTVFSEPSIGPGATGLGNMGPGGMAIETVLPRELALHVIALFFEHIYCIIPIIHRPTFMADLAAHEEEKSPIFFGLVMSMIAITLIHVPKSFFPIPAESVRRLSDHCLKYSYALTRRAADQPNIDYLCIKYFQSIIHNKHGQTGLEAAGFGEMQYLAVGMGYHREEVNPIEAERRRRMFFTIYNADKHEALARGRPVMMRSDEFMRPPETVALPTELDDKCITENGYLPGSTVVPLICGFNDMTRMASVLGDILVHERDMRRNPPNEPEQMLAALREVRTMQARLKSIADKLPRPFQLDGDGDGEDLLPQPGWEIAIRDELDMFFSDPLASESAKDGYLVMKANIHVTLAMIRLRLILHREDLLNRSGAIGTPSRHAAELVASDLGESVDWRHLVYQDLFKAVHGIPIQALAANGPSLVTKIRVVAVTLLDALPAQDYDHSNVQGIAAYLLDFLNIMTSIENQFAD
ncbi:hypothetical protein TREMEDRAFT_69554 [Tremella mesenterica DSM 1558]|uniref:uncharacterized protein n=1 Tax=Tremella mesenterica (strain ATCC 24925 / CBS 8224 / DSM 1558 / NBRC 9311 / NRRL Y-6157 / RJB 2259-6 / UBC 559-6) TaxID=578456 RepID=UPI0003F4A580|nr:uncharacterized protein TREMEDRAFT_69554 [Tremella mesenterica DSM 1558]EIW68075.1 hypothetical protein TREMEDRAFT_69554 [Tremella mesenterica DSM 1558]